MKGVMYMTFVILTHFVSNVATQQEFKIGLLIPWNGTYQDVSALTSASAVSLAIEDIHADKSLSDHIRLR